MPAKGTVKPSADERRRFPRYAVNLVSEVRDATGVPHRGRVRDLCLGGALLAGLDESWLGKLRPGMPLELRFDLAASHGITTAPVRAKVARVMERGLGVQFDASDGPALESLRRLIERVLARAPETPGEGPATQPLSVAERTRGAVIVQRLTEQRTKELLNAWIASADESLWRAAEQAENNAHKQRLADDSARLGHLRATGDCPDLRARLRERGNESVIRHAEGQENGNGLELVDPEDFETWLEATTLVRRLEDELGEPMATLEAQVRGALGPEARLQLVPRCLAEAFDAWAESEGLSPQGRRLALGSGRHVLPRLLGAFYHDLGRALTEAGLPPSTVTAPGMSRELEATGRDHPTPIPSAKTPPARSAPQAARPGAGRAASARVAELLAALPADALKLGARDAHGSLEEQTRRLLGRLDPALGGHPLPPVVHERIEATERLLGHVTGKQAATPHIAAWADQLGLRILSAAVADPEFFRPPGHPLLQLLERLDHLALSLPTEPDADDGGRIRELDGLVQQALQCDARDREGFQPVIDAARSLERHQGERLRRTATHAICQLEGRDRRRAALDYVRSGLERRFAGRPIHGVVGEVINAAWATLLQLRYLREGEGGEQLARTWQVLEALVDLCSGGPGEPTEGIESVEPELVAGLAYLGFDPFLARDLTQRVREAARLQRTGLLGEGDCPIYQPPESRASAETALDGLEPEAVADLSAQVDALGPGGVLGLRGGKQLQRLIWVSPNRTEFAFLDGREGKLRSFSREALIMGLHSGDLELKAPGGGALGERALDVTLREMQERVRYHETRDRLTGLYNQYQLTGKLADVLARHHAGDYLLGFLDIDHFDAINTTCGHGAGEQLLKAVSGLMRQRLTPPATLSFLGGRRFGFLLPPGDLGAGLATCEQLCRDVYGLRFEWQGKGYPVTGSIGAVLARPGEGDPDSLFSAAAVACTTAQEGGGNRLQLFSEDDEAISQSRERLRWLAIAEEAIKSERIRLRVQMIAPVDPESGRSHHHEVLMRVFDAQGRELDLAHFIATAEAFNLMGQADRLVVRKAIAWAGENQGLLARLGSIAINLSGVSLSDPSLPGFIRTQLEQAGMSPSRVSFEVTETTAIANMKRAAGIIRSIQDIGCRVALDDFGTGMSSYSYLKSLPVDFVKIDGFFIRDLVTNPHDLAIVKSINEIAHFMGIQTIAEFAEKEEIIERLAEIGVDFVQGYAVRPPLFLDEISPDY